MPDQSDPEVLIRLPASPLRRWSALVLLGLFAMMAVQVSIELPGERPLAKAGALLLGLAMIWQAIQLWKASGRVLELTVEGLREAGTGRVLARVEDIAEVNRSVFAYRPATGFLILLHRPASRPAWAPGMWWRFGRRIGIGGVTPKMEGKALAELLGEMVRSRADPWQG